MDKKIGDVIEVSGKIQIKDEVRKDGKASKLLRLPFEGDFIYSRVISGSKEYDIVNGNIVSGNTVTIKGELKTLAGQNNAKVNYMGIDEISVEENHNEKNQIIREDARNKFVEAMVDSFEIGKLRLNFISYDTTRKAGERQTANIAIYLDLADANYFCESILNGFYASKIRAEKKAVQEGKQTYEKPIDEFFGGTSAAVLKKRGQSRPDGKALARVLTVEASKSNDMLLCLTAQQGPGLEGNKGEIQPMRSEFEDKVSIPLSTKAAIRFATSVKDAILAHKVANAVADKFNKGE